MWRAIFLAALAFGAQGLCLAADQAGIITILEGDATLTRGLARMHAVEGLRIVPGDIVETAPSSFVQVELVDRSAAQMGGATRALFSASTGRAKPERSMYLLSGWLKLVGSNRDPAAGVGFDLRSPLIEVPASAAVVVLRESAHGVDAFVESGTVSLVERQPGSSNAAALPMKAGDFYTRRGSERGVLSTTPPHAFVDDLPRSFRDSLPARAERYRNAQVKPKEAPEFGYADVESWLKAEPQVRRPLMQRWRAKAREPAFRSALIANLAAHPEWDPILFPEKYKPKEHPVARAVATSARPASAAANPATAQ